MTVAIAIIIDVIVTISDFYYDHYCDYDGITSTIIPITTVLIDGIIGKYMEIPLGINEESLDVHSFPLLGICEMAALFVQDANSESNIWIALRRSTSP